MPSNLENLAMAIGLEKVSFHSNLKEKQCQKCSRTFKLPPIALISHTSKKNAPHSPSQASTIHETELEDVQAGFKEGRGTTDQIANIKEKASKFQKNIYFCFIDYAKGFD